MHALTVTDRQTDRQRGKQAGMKVNSGSQAPKGHMDKQTAISTPNTQKTGRKHSERP